MALAVLKTNPGPAGLARLLAEVAKLRWLRCSRCVAVFYYLEISYNPRRRHSARGYLSPPLFEQKHHHLLLHTTAAHRHTVHQTGAPPS